MQVCIATTLVMSGQAIPMKGHSIHFYGKLIKFSHNQKKKKKKFSMEVGASPVQGIAIKQSQLNQ